MRASILIPTRDRKDMLVEAIESIRRQELPNDGTELEIVVADDGSRDGTWNAIRSRFPDVSLTRSPSLGPGGARNRAASMATGELFFFLDSDDTWRSRHVAAMLPHFREGAAVVAGIAENRSLLDGSRFRIPEPGTLPSGRVFPHLVHWCQVVPSALAVTREAFFSVDGFPEIPNGEDWLFALSLADRYPFVLVPEIVTDRRLHDESLSAAGSIRDQMERVHLTARAHIATLESTSPADLSNLETKLQLIRTRGTPWTSIQDFYIAAKAHGLTTP